MRNRIELFHRVKVDHVNNIMDESQLIYKLRGFTRMCKHRERLRIKENKK